MTREPFDQFAIRLHDSDDVAVLKRPLTKGTRLSFPGYDIIAATDINATHKIALRAIAQGQPVRRYGQIIGQAKQPISSGDHVHTHNLVGGDFSRQYEFCIDARPVEYRPLEQMRHFQGYLRPDGRVGTRNYVAVISNVNCSATVCRYVAERFNTDQFRRDYPNVDGVIAITHKSGCTTPPGESADMLRRVIVGFARHPNIAGYVMIGLGCEGNQISTLRQRFALDVLRPDEPPPAFLTIQDIGGTRKTVEAGVAAVAKLLPLANQARRTAQPISRLILAENCGGSDGNSGITANPALGVASDELVRYGGTSVLAETPEI